MRQQQRRLSRPLAQYALTAYPASASASALPLLTFDLRFAIVLPRIFFTGNFGSVLLPLPSVFRPSVSLSVREILFSTLKIAKEREREWEMFERISGRIKASLWPGQKSSTKQMFGQ